MTIRIYDHVDRKVKVIFGNDVNRYTFINIVLNIFIGGREINYMGTNDYGWELYDVEGEIPSQIWMNKNVIEYAVTGIETKKAVLSFD